MVTRLGTFIAFAFAEGLFLAIHTKTGEDVSPAGLGLRIFGFLEPYATEKTAWILQFGEIVLIIVPWLGFIVALKNYGIKGVVAFLGITIASYFFILSYSS